MRKKQNPKDKTSPENNNPVAEVNIHESTEIVNITFKKRPIPPQRLTLPGLMPIIQQSNLAPISNWLAKTGIFAPRSGKDKGHTGANWLSMECPRGYSILYNGPQLDMSEHTLYLHLMKLAEGKKPGEVVQINRHQLLRQCGRESNIGGANYKWLSKALDRLSQATIKICVDNAILTESQDFSIDANSEEEKNGQPFYKVNLTIRLIGQLAELPDTGEYYFTLDPTSLALFASQLYGYNDLAKRRLLQKCKTQANLAMWLQSYVCSDHQGTHEPIFVETLWRFSASKSRLNDFTTRLKSAFENIQEAKIITSWNMFLNEKNERPMVIWTR